MSRTIKKEYTKSKAIDKTCRCHGGCPYCEGNRLIRAKKEIVRVSDKLIDEEWESSSSDWREVNKKESEDFYYKNFYSDFDYYYDGQETSKKD